MKQILARWRPALTRRFFITQDGKDLTITALWYRRLRALLIISLALNLLLIVGLSRALDHRKADGALLNNVHFLAVKAQTLTELYARQIQDLTEAFNAYGRSFAEPAKQEAHLHRYHLSLDAFEQRTGEIRALGEAIATHANAITSHTRRTE